jgi:hypothetical protein
MEAFDSHRASCRLWTSEPTSVFKLQASLMDAFDAVVKETYGFDDNEEAISSYVYYIFEETETLLLVNTSPTMTIWTTIR